MRSWLNLAVRLGGIADAMEYKVTQQLEFFKIQLGLLTRRDSDTYYLSTNAEIVDFLSSCHLWALLLELGWPVAVVCAVCLGCRRRVPQFGRELVFIDYKNVAT